MKITRNITLPKGGSTEGQVFELKSFKQLTDIMLNENYSLGLFKDNLVLKNNFISAKAIALDFDENYTLKQAVKEFKEYKHVIATTKSHQKLKHGKKCDRFRVIVFFNEEIKDNETYFTTWKSLEKLYPALDVQCKNSNRFFYPSLEIISENKTGKLFDVVKNDLDLALGKKEAPKILELKGHGKLSKKTKNALKKGLEPGSRNGETFKIAKDFQENGFSEDEAVKYITKAFSENETLSYDFTEFEVENTIRSAYASEPTNEPRKPFKLIPIKELYKIETKLEWIVEHLLSKGGVSLLSAVPKAGKSQIARQLMSAIATGGKFLGRATIKGEVHYYAIEEQAEVVNASFKKLGLPADSNLFVHVGEVFSENRLKDLHQVLKERKPALIVIDTLFDVLDVESENNYKDVKKELRNLRHIARDTNTHIMCIHHSNKSTQGVTGNHRGVLGSQAIVGGVDVIILIEMNSDMRVITTMGRSIKKWTTRELIWDDEKELYTLGDKVSVDEY